MAMGKSGGAPSVDLAAVGLGEWIKTLIVRGRRILAGAAPDTRRRCGCERSDIWLGGIAKSPAARSGNQKGPVRTDGVFGSGGRPASNSLSLLLRLLGSQ